MNVTVQLKYKAENRNKVEAAVSLAGIYMMSLFWSAALFKLLSSMFGWMWNFEVFTQGTVGQGLLRMWNRFAETLGQKDYMKYPLFEVKPGETGLAITLLCLATSVIGYFLIKNNFRGLHYVVNAFIFVIIIFTNVEVDGILFVVWLFASVALLLVDGKMSGADIYVRFAASIMMLVVLILVNTPGVERLAYETEGTVKLRSQIKTAIEDMRYGSNILKEGRLKQEERRSSKAGTALILKGKKLRPMYLRGFIGESYEAGQWTTAQPARYYRNQALFYWMEKKSFPAESQLATAYNVNTDRKKLLKESNTIDVTNVGARRKYAYAPYEIVRLRAKTRSYPGSINPSLGIRGQSRYSFQVADTGYWKWPEKTAELYARKQTRNKEEYYKTESHYNSFVYSSFLQVPDELRREIKDTVGEDRRTKEGHISYKQAIRFVNYVLYKKSLYSIHAGKSEEGILNFIKTRKGYDAHIASAATMLFRYYGIPARYVEGYVVSDEDIRKARGEEVEVPKNNNHAWTEIYVDGLGFVPVEMSQPFVEKMRQPDLSKGLRSNVSLNPFRIKSKKTVTKKHKDEVEKIYEFPWVLILKWAVSLLILLLMLVVAALLLRRVRYAHRKKKVFLQSDAKKGAAAIYGEILDIRAMLAETGGALSCGIPEDEELLDGDELEIAGRAAFSTRSVTEEERRKLYARLSELKKMISRRGKTKVRI